MELYKHQSCDRVAEILKILGHPVRLKIFIQLLSRHNNVTHISECLGLPQPTVSAHLALLKAKQIIERSRKGKEVFYQVTSQQARQVVAALDRATVDDF